MRHMKNIAAALIALAIATPALAGGIPVIDMTQISQNQLSHVESIAKYVEQIQHLMTQIEEMKKHYEAITGNRELGNFSYNPKFRDYLPPEWKSTYDSVRKGGYGGLSGAAKAIYEGAKAFDSCQNFACPEAMVACQARAVKGSVDKANAMAAFDIAKERIGQIEDLMGAISGAEDPKAMQEIQARIAIEQSALANEHTKMQMMEMVAEAEDKMVQQQEHEQFVQRLTKKDTSVLPVLTFD